MKFHNITHDDMSNGAGLRVCLWVSGCTHACVGCHNPITHNPHDGIEFNDEAKKEIFSQLDNEYISGITLTGGDPLHPLNRGEITSLIKEIASLYPNKSIWLYTGFKYEEIKDLELIDYIDVLCDSKFEQDKKNISLKWVGSTNQRVIDIKKTIKEKKIILLGE